MVMMTESLRLRNIYLKNRVKIKDTIKTLFQSLISCEDKTMETNMGYRALVEREKRELINTIWHCGNCYGGV